MGIEDFKIDISVSTDRVIVISPGVGDSKTVRACLEKRAYSVREAKSFDEAAGLQHQETADLLIYLHTDNSASVFEALSKRALHSETKRLPLLVLHHDPESVTADERAKTLGDVPVLKFPVEPAQLLVKVALALRMRKLKTEELRRDAKLSEQNAQLRDLTARYQKELREAQSIQQNILPKTLPQDPRCSFAAKYVPLEAMGGDLYDAWQIDADRFGLFLGDVTGHGLPAALIGAMTKMVLSYAPKDNPAKTLTQMSEGIADHMPEGRFVTVTAGIYNAATNELQIACGGNPSPCIWRAGKKAVEEVSTRGLPLGISKIVRYELFKTELGQNDTLVMATDGLIETASMAGDFWGIKGLSSAIEEKAGELDLDKLLDYLLAQQQEFAGGRILKDDNTLLALRRTSQS